MSDSKRSESKLVRMARDYALDVRPPRIQRQQFSALMKGQFKQLSEAEQLDIANALCLCHHIDLDITSLIAEAPTSVSGRFLRFSPRLDETMLSALTLNADHERKLSIARRRDLPKSVARILRDAGDEQINRALDLRQKPKTNAAAPSTVTSTIVDKILTAARARDLNSLCALLVQRLSITRESAFVILAEKSSANLIIALKYCGLQADQAWETYTLLAPGMAEKVGQQDAFYTSFQSYDHDECSSTVKNWILDDLLAQVTAPSIANDELGAPNEAAFNQASGLRKSA